ncbi:hypothetical protein OG429_22115 [Streptomyces sp. NBC_00190]|nr:hypothetical protein [Streptomyces sp. NBC_00190]WSZ45314.1 hypothetical protein OG239_24880 [Streptomyces sp. NBC_00868]
MADLLWDDVSYFFDPDLMGSLPDVRVPDIVATPEREDGGAADPAARS